MAEGIIKVLVVDDEKIIREFFCRLLTLQGLEVKQAEDGYKAIELCKNERFDLFFIDMRMPGLDGLQTYRQLHKIHPLAQTALMTGYALDEALEQAKQEGVSIFIRKPFAIDQIRSIVSRVAAVKKRNYANILVVDDDQKVLDTFSNLLKDRVQKFRLASSREDVLDALKSDKYDLVFFNLALKNTDGVCLYKELRKIFPYVSVVIINPPAHKHDEIDEPFKISGCLSKPQEIEGLIDYIDKIKQKGSDPDSRH